MDELGFDIGGLLNEEEANKLFEDLAEEQTEDAQPEENENEPAEEEEETQPSEKVGEEDNEDSEDATGNDDDGSSPNVYSSIASALKKDGIFPDFEESEIEAATTPEAFAELFQKAIEAREDERTRRVNEALGNGVQPDTIKMYEQTIQYLGSINEETLNAEGDEGEDLRKQLIYNDLVNRGYSHEKAMKEVEKSFKSGSDIDDAKDALQALQKYYHDGYADVQEKAKKQAEEARAKQKKQADDFKKLVLEDDVKLGENVLDKNTCKKVYDAVSTPVYKDPDSGSLLTAVQKFQKEHPLEFLKQLGMWFVLTDGGKNMEGFTKAQVRAEKNKAIKELGRKINSTALNSDGSLRYVSGGKGDSDPLLSDGWKVGW